MGGRPSSGPSGKLFPPQTRGGGELVSEGGIRRKGLCTEATCHARTDRSGASWQVKGALLETPQALVLQGGSHPTHTPVREEKGWKRKDVSEMESSPAFDSGDRVRWPPGPRGGLREASPEPLTREPPRPGLICERVKVSLPAVGKAPGAQPRAGAGCQAGRGPESVRPRQEGLQGANVSAVST